MFTLWSDIDRLFNRSFADMFNDRMMQRFENCDACAGAYRMNLLDRGENLEFVAELPGVDRSAVQYWGENMDFLFFSG